ncbi:MAG: hypothetical protein AAFU77_01145 [Myxococcota bacterium]
MSDHYRLSFNFALPAYGPEEWPKVFQALAQDRKPDASCLGTLPHVVREYLADPTRLGLAMADERLGSPVEMKRLWSSKETAYHAKSPEWEVRFTVSMHDDEYANYGYMLELQIFDVVGDNGLYCSTITENQKDSVTHLYKSDDDLIRVHLAAPSTRYWVPPEYLENRGEFPTARSPELGFSLHAPTVISAEQRAQAFAGHREDMRAAGAPDYE